MSVLVSDLAAWLNSEYPQRDWDQWCAKLMWNSVYFVSGVEEREMTSYDPAKAAYRASEIVSLAPGNAPPGALHYFANPAVDGHVALDVGDGLVLMTGTKAALGDDAQMLGKNYGLTTIGSYMRAKGNPYLGYSHTYGVNPSILNRISINPPPPKPEPEPTPALGEIMAFKSIGIGYRPVEGEDRLISVGLDYETGQELSETILPKSYGDSFYKATTEGGFVVVSKGHYEKLRAEFASVVEMKRKHELELARATGLTA